MAQLTRYIGLVAMWVLVGQALSPCVAPVVQAQELEECSVMCNGTACCTARCWNSTDGREEDCLEAQQGCLTQCGPPTEEDNEPVCCGSGVDCYCPGYENLSGYDRICNGGYGSYCCCHDTCCRLYGWFGCLTFCWVQCVGGCYMF